MMKRSWRGIIFQQILLNFDHQQPQGQFNLCGHGETKPSQGEYSACPFDDMREVKLTGRPGKITAGSCEGKVRGISPMDGVE